MKKKFFTIMHESVFLPQLPQPPLLPLLFQARGQKAEGRVRRKKEVKFADFCLFIRQYGSVKPKMLISDVKFRSLDSFSSTSVFWFFGTKL